MAMLSQHVPTKANAPNAGWSKATRIIQRATRNQRDQKTKKENERWAGGNTALLLARREARPVS